MLKNSKETLESYRAERKAFIFSLRNFYDIDFYKLDVEERNAWLATYIEYKREFMESMILTKKEAFKDYKKNR